MPPIFENASSPVKNRHVWPMQKSLVNSPLQRATSKILAKAMFRAAWRWRLTAGAYGAVWYFQGNPSHMLYVIYVLYIYLHLGDFVGANVGKYSIHGTYGHGSGRKIDILPEKMIYLEKHG